MRIIFCALAFLFLISPALAGPFDGSPDVAKAEAYLRGLSTAKARFVQTNHDGQQFSGTFYLNRPGRMRFEYDPPVKDFIVADGFFVYFYDSQLGEQSNAPIGQTMADFLLRTDLRLSGDIAVTSVTRAGGLLQIMLTQAGDPEAGTLRLGFVEEPFHLKRWRVVDAQGLITEVELFDLKTGLDLPSSLFVYADPGRAVQRYNR